MIFQSNVFDQFNSVMEKGDVARFRVYEVSCFLILLCEFQTWISPFGKIGSAGIFFTHLQIFAQLLQIFFFEPPGISTKLWSKWTIISGLVRLMGKGD